MATATTTRRTRKAATPEVQNVTTRRGGKVHAPNTILDWPFPRCRTGVQTRQPTHGRYVHTTDAVTCEKCVEIIRADRGARNARESLPGRAAAAERTPTGDPYKGKETPRASRARRNGTAQDEAAVQAAQIIGEKTNEIIAKRGTHAEMDEKRNPKCSDEDYALAVRVRELRAGGLAWWAIAHQMGLKGSGPSVKLGKTGAAHARRLWEKAWGKTYTDTSVPRETKARVAERAITQPGKPYFAGDASDMEIIDAVQGHEITWVTRLAAGDGVVGSVQKAVVKPGSARVMQGPKGRVINFFEMVKDEGSAKLGSGPQRSVYVDRIEKVAL